MGESETEYFSNDDRMIVMWNMDDYPIPPGVDIRSIRPTIVAALRKMGFSGRDQIWAYGGRVPYDLGELAKEAITYVPKKPIPPVQENDRTVVFWDVGDCPFPIGSTPDEIYSRIYEALRKRNSGTDVKIWAYVDEKNGPWTGEHLRNKTWPSRLYFLPGGASRRNRMLNDILILVIGSIEAEESYQLNVIVVSDQFRGDYFNNRLERLSDGYRYFVFLVTPTESVNKPDVPEWPGLLFDHAVSFPRRNRISLKKHKPEETAEMLVD